MNLIGPPESTTSQPEPEPDRSTRLTPATVALSFTIILIQVQAAFQGSSRNLLPVLIAALLVMAGVARSLQARVEKPQQVAALLRIMRPAPGRVPGAGRVTLPELYSMACSGTSGV